MAKLVMSCMQQQPRIGATVWDLSAPESSAARLIPMHAKDHHTQDPGAGARGVCVGGGASGSTATADTSNQP